jgi:hypothetical protein
MFFDLLAIPGAFISGAVETDLDLFCILIGFFVPRRFALLGSELYYALGIKILRVFHS